MNGMNTGVMGSHAHNNSMVGNSPIDNKEFLVNLNNISNQLNMNNSGSQPKMNLKLNLNGINNHVDGKEHDSKVVGFHQEFMSRLDEFSESWRQAALKEKYV